MIRLFYFLLPLFIVGTLVLQSASLAAEEPSPLPEPTPDTTAEEDAARLRGNLEEQGRIKAELSKLTNQERTLQEQITFADSQIRLSTLKIQEAQAKLAAAERELIKLEIQIHELETRIGRIGTTLDQLVVVFEERIRETYMRSRLSPFELFLSSDGFGDFLSRYHYLRIIQLNDRKLLYQLQATRANYTGHKETLEEKQAQIESARARITQEKANLEVHTAEQEKLKRDKEALLSVTRNEEERYQAILELLQGEARSLAHIAIVDGEVTYAIDVSNLTNLGSIGRGGHVGRMGNTGAPGCSTGPHLHFEALEDAAFDGGKLRGKLANPAERLSPKTLFVWTTNQSGEVQVVGGGTWSWPMADPQMTQGYGQTYWSSWYKDNFHTAIDMVPDGYPEGNWDIFAADSGTVYAGVLYYGGCSPTHVRIIDHGGGSFSLYWHLE